MLAVVRPEPLVVRALTVLKDMPCSTGLCEKGHAAGAVLRKYHSRYGSELIAARALVCQSAPLFSATKEDRCEEKLRRSLAKLRDRPIVYTGRNHFCSQVAGAFHNSNDRVGSQRFVGQQDVVSQHNELYERLPMSKRNAIGRLVAKTRSELSEFLERQRTEVRAAFGLRNVTSAIKFSEAQVVECAECFGQIQGSSLKVVPAPAMPTDYICRVIETLGQLFSVKTPRCAWWSKHIIANRERFASTAVAMAPDEDQADDLPEVMFCLAVASQQPPYAIFLEARRLSSDDAALSDGDFRQAGVSMYKTEWKFFRDSELPVDEDAELVITETAWCADCIACVSRLHPFERFVASHPRPVVRAQREGRRGGGGGLTVGKTSLKRQLMDEFPWLSGNGIEEAIKKRRMDKDRGHVDKLGEKLAKGIEEESEGDDEDDAIFGEHSGKDVGKKQTVEQGAAQDSQDEGPPGPAKPAGLEEAFADVAGELADIREEHAGNEQEEAYFVLRIQGGTWTKAHRGVAADSATSYARSFTKLFCKKYKWPKQKGFAFAKYGEFDSVQLAKEWVRKGNHFARLWYEGAGGAVDFKLAPEGDHPCPDDGEWLDWCTTIDSKSAAWPRILEVRAAVPS